MAPALRTFALALRAATTCPSSPTCPQDDQCSLTSNGATLQVSCATDYYGGDLQLTQTSTLAGCIRACSTTTGCNAASYVNGNCYLKSTLNAAQPNPNVVGVAVISRDDATTPTPVPDTPNVCPASFTCPENNGCSYTDGPRTLTLSCGVDFYGGDLTNQYAASLEACTQACADNSQCAAASFVGGKGEGRCYLKNTKNGSSANDGVDAVYVVSNSVQPSSSAASSTPSSSSTIASTSTIHACLNFIKHIYLDFVQYLHLDLIQHLDFDFDFNFDFNLDLDYNFNLNFDFDLDPDSHSHPYPYPYTYSYSNA